MSQLIEVVTEGEPNEWWEGRIGAQVGWFPSAYCSAPFDEGIEASGVGEDGEGEATGGGGALAVALYPFEVITCFFAA